MAQGIEVPQTTPNAPQFQVPTDLVNAYLARKQNEQKMFLGATEDLGSSVNAMRQQKIQNQLAALEAYSKIAGTSGITAANQMVPNIPGGMSTQNLPSDPFLQRAQVPIQPQSNIPPAGTPQNATVPTVQDQTPSPFIQASLAQGHPDVAGVGSFHAPQDSNVAPPLPTLAPQMAQNNADILQASHVGGSYAANRVKSLSEANTGLAAQDTAMQAPIKFAQEQKNFQQTQTREANQFEIAQANEKGRARAGVAEKVAPTLTASSQLEGVFNQLSKINADLNNKSIPFTGNLGAKYAKQVPSTKSKWALNQAQAESQADVGAGAIEKLVEGRYNDQQMARIKEAMFPTGNELGTPRAAQKLAFFKQYVQQMKMGSVNQANAALDSIAGGSFSPMGMAAPIASPQDTPTGLTGPHGQTVIQNGHTYTWNAQTKQYE